MVELEQIFMLPERGKRCHLRMTEICIAFGNNPFQFIGLQCISDKRRNDCEGQINVAEITPRGNLLRTERRQLYGDIQPAIRGQTGQQYLLE